MGVHFYIDQIQEIKQLIYNEIKKKGVEIDKDLFFNEYYLKIREIETASKEEKPYFNFFKVSPEPKNFVFGGGVSSNMGDIYFSFHINDNIKIDKPYIKIGDKVWGYRGLETVDQIYVEEKQISNVDYSFIKAQPTCTDKVFGPVENNPVNIQVI